MCLEVLAKSEKGLECEVIYGGYVKGHRHVNLPGTIVKLPGITETDKQDILFGIEQNIDIIALSFVRNAETIREARDLLGDSSEHIKLIAKIENQEGVDRLEEIAKEADELISRAREGNLEIHEVQDGTFTINNTGALDAMDITSSPGVDNPPCGSINTPCASIDYVLNNFIGGRK